ncbi:peptide-N(4)-(N-acetyl-beta-glucosaminyl)asparagine amidase isoform X2 [Hippocampus zosterae]|uniref:peptide-N(4)-(N-acetyl-beta- glucosaminyl)asparagine amidase isoform X2 n=1 Tax=Hippocampus zosterae TaxID=109293 RepID=UPI00223CCA79|nr:peptide-N(4)-(N-acetyl-beta-glucosaminyl)asparagine amidase isoform X2 [Hippocampus zosterae]
MALTPAVTELCENPNDVFFDVCKLLLSYADNILRDPYVEKYRKIHIGSPTFSSKLLPFSGAVECLFEMGFEESDTHLVFSKSASLEQLKVIRESIAAQRDQRLDAGQQVHLLAEAPAESPPSSNQAVSSLPVQPSSQVGSKNFSGTLQSNFQHVLLYENPELQQKARSCIPHKQLLYAAKQKLKLAQQAETECKLGEEDFLVLELLRWFKHDFFSWVDCLPCNNCGGSTQNSGSLTPTIDDLRWGAQRVENHYCQGCQLCTRFPRYNNPEQLLKTRRGRCGEWANCFTLCCRALCLEARYIWDSTDHVWTEVYSVSQRRWLHCDPCENICDKPLLYEVGWGKKLSYILAFSRDQVVDVTWRYSCKHPEVLSRRTNVQETWLLHTIIGLNALRQQSLGVDRKLELAERLLVELVEFISPKIPKQGELGGRTSGSLGWRQARGETGDADSETIKQVYIARIEGSSVGQISWKFDFGPAKLSVKSVSIRTSSQTFSLGEVSWLLQSGMIITEFSGDGSMQSFQCLNSSSEFTVTAQLRGGEGNASWQHAQLFRQSLRDTEESPFEIIIHLENT